MRHIVILGAGTAGTIMANRLRRKYAGDIGNRRLDITIVDQDEVHIYQPGLLFIPFGIYRREDVVRSRRAQVHPDVNYRAAKIERVLPDEHQVELTEGERLPYDVLIIATGTRVAPEETEGLTGEGWRERIFDFYTLDGSVALGKALESFTEGRLVVNVVDMPIKCPVAPLEFAFLADAYFASRGLRDKVQITYATPLDAAFTKPVTAATLSHLLAEKRIELVTEFNAGRVDGGEGKLYSWDEREVPFDLLVTIPLHMGAEFVSRSQGLGDDMGFVRTDPHTLQSTRSPDIFAIGDATDIATSKAGSVAHFEAEVLTENIVKHLAGQPLDPEFDGHANCFIETGYDRALLIDFNFDTEPLPGRFPFSFGPMRLLEESRLNHAGKLAFRWAYWHMLLPGHDIPGVGARMSMRGKRRPPGKSATPPTPHDEHTTAAATAQR